MSAPDRIVLFRFHRDPEVCRSRLALLRQLNPDVPIHGLGERVGLADALDSLYVPDPGEEACDDFAWRHGDIAVAEWFEAVGRDPSFDVCHLLEWDLLPCEPLDDLYADVPADGLALSGLLPIEAARERDWSWITDTGRYRHADDYREIRAHVAEQFGSDRAAPACVFPGAAFPRAFLAAVADCDVPRICTDEVRVPLFAEALGFDLYDTGFYDWDDDGGLFNCVNDPIPRDRIQRELVRPDGRRTFHPVREPVSPEWVLERVV